MKNRRENLLRLFRREGYAYAPAYFNLCPSLQEELKRRYGAGATADEVFDLPMRAVTDRTLRQDCTDFSRFYPAGSYDPAATEFSIWGVGHEGSRDAMHMTRMLHPMADFTSMAEFRDYPYPRFDPDGVPAMREEIAAIRAAGVAALARMSINIWEIAWYLRGMENLMMEMMTDEGTAVYHLDRVTAIAKERAAAFGRAGADVLLLGDDIGMQQTIMMSEELYRRHLKWRLKEVVAAAKAARPELVVAYHSCGFIEPFIDDLIDCGVEVLNPVQPECMDFAAIHARYGDRLSFWGTIGTQSTMPFSTPEEVVAAVRRNLEIAGPRGGLLCTPTHLLEPEVPWANIEAYAAACRAYRP